MIFTFLTLCALGGLIQTSESAASLYRNALSSLEEGRRDLAVESLRQIVVDHPETELAIYARLYLAEQMHLAAQHEECFQFLARFKQRYSTESKATRPQEERLELLLARSVIALAQENRDPDIKLHWLSRVPWTALDDDSSLKSLAILEIAKSVVASVEMGQSSTRIDEYFQQTWALCGAVSREESQAIESQARFAIAEALTQAALHAEAETQWRRLREQFSRGGGTPPDWSATVMLRLCECLLAQGRSDELPELLSEGRRLAGRRLVLELQLLESRWLVSRVNFEKAKRLLQQVSKAAGSAEASDGGFPELQAEAQWRLGELLFLQKNYAAACLAYERSIAVGQAAWTGLAQVQLAKCLELDGRILEAKQAYQQILAESNASRVAIAQDRIRVIDAYESRTASRPAEVLQ